MKNTTSSVKKHVIFLNCSRSVTTSLFLLLVTACGGSGGNSGSTDDGNTGTDAPTVSSTSPADNASNVARDAQITATFNKDILNTSVNASSFTLSGSGADNIVGSVSFDGVNNVVSFIPGTPLSMLTTYTATLSSDIIDLSGNALANNYNWSFTTADGGWGDAQLIEDDTSDANSPQIAFDANGNALAVWHQSDGTRKNIWASRFDGTSWGSAEVIGVDVADGGNAFEPQITFNINGNAFVVWKQTRSISNLSTFIWANHFNGTTWTGAEKISNLGVAFDPQIAVDSDGNAMAVWTESGFQFKVWVNRFNGITWGDAERLNSGAGDAFQPQIAFDNNDNALAVWGQDAGNNHNNIVVRRFSGGVWGVAETIENTDTGNAVSPQIAFDNDSNALAVWRQSDDQRINIWSNRFNGTGWGSAEIIGIDSGAEAFDPQIEFDANGNAFAIWLQNDDTGQKNILVNRFDGTSWSNVEIIDSSVNDASKPQIAIDTSGKALAVWQQSGNIMANHFNGNSWLGAERIDSENLANAAEPQVAFDNNGNALAVWHQSDITRFNIWANHFK